ncbi:hypothetical protein KC946_03155 [Candidatus Saccharibacteria bacterium]|nr:hypothetical protein [Candidatus Saccharibacteria bacterium]
MNPLVLIAILFAAPILLILLSKANAALVFLALCAGFVLQAYIGEDAQALIQGLLNNYDPNVGQYIRLGVMLTPPLFAVLFLRSSVQGGKNLINVVPAISVGIVNVFLAVPLLPDNLKSSVYGTSLWSDLSQFQAIFIGVSVFISMAIVLSGKRGHKKKHRKKG